MADAKKSGMENPVYTMQYAHARLCRILERFKGQDMQLQDCFHPDERALILHMLSYEEIIVEVFEQFLLKA